MTNYCVYGLGLLYEADDAGNTKTYHFDYRGSTVALTDGGGNVTDRAEYSAYGSTTYRTGTTDTPFLFNGRYGVQTDANGLLYKRARYYNPYLCRFLNPDPEGFAVGVNFYVYADGNPISQLDPLGLFSWESAGMGAAKAVIGVVAGVLVGAAIVATAPASVVVGVGIAAAGAGGFATGMSVYEGASGQHWTASGNGAELTDDARSESIGHATVGVASLAVLGSSWGRAGADKDLAWMKMSSQDRMLYDNDLKMLNNSKYAEIKDIPPGERGLTASDQGFSWKAISQGLGPASRGAFAISTGSGAAERLLSGSGGK